MPVMATMFKSNGLSDDTVVESSSVGTDRDDAAAGVARNVAQSQGGKPGVMNCNARVWWFQEKYTFAAAPKNGRGGRPQTIHEQSVCT